MTARTPEESPLYNSNKKNAIPFDRLIADSHLNKTEIQIIKDAYLKDKENLKDLTKNSLKNFIVSEYGNINKNYLGGKNGISKLQQKLKTSSQNGEFDTDTFHAIMDYQNKNGLSIDGIVWQKTQESMGIKNQLLAENTELLPNIQKWNTSKTKTEVYIAPYGTTDDYKSIPQEQKAYARQYQENINQIFKNVDIVNSVYKDSTGVIWKTQDWIWETTGGWKSAKEIHIESIKRQTEQARHIYKMILADQNKLGATESNRLIAELNTKIPTLKLDSITVTQAVISSTITAGHAINGTVEWVYNTVKWAITGTVDLLQFCYNYGGSWINNPTYKNQIDKQMGEVWNYIQTNSLQKMGWNISEIIKKEWKRINTLPENERAYAIGNIGWNIIGMLSVMKIGSSMVGHISKMGWKVAQAERISVRLAERGAGFSERAERVAQLWVQAQRAIYGWLAINTILNGIAESAISVGFIKSLWTLKVSLASLSITSSEKLKAVKERIIEVSIELQKNVSDTTRNVLEDIQARLEILKEKLENLWQKEQRNKKSPKEKTWEKVNKPQENTTGPESKKNDNSKASEWMNYEKPPKSFETTGIDTKKLIRKMNSYYHPDKNNHPLAGKIQTELNILSQDYKNNIDIQNRLELLAKNPEKYLKNKWANPSQKPDSSPDISKEVNITKVKITEYEKMFSDNYLNAAARENHGMFGDMLMQKKTIWEIKELIDQDPVVWIQKWGEFMKNPKTYIEFDLSGGNVTYDLRKNALIKNACEGIFSDSCKIFYGKHPTNESTFEKSSQENIKQDQSYSWVEQANKYNAMWGNDRFSEKLLDWFMDGWQSLKWFSSKVDAELFIQNISNGDIYDMFKVNGKYGVWNRELIHVNRKTDSVLQRIIMEDLWEIRRLPNQKSQAEAVLKLIYKKSEKNFKPHLDDWLKWIRNLWDIMEEWAAVCRHRSLLVKVLCEELGIEVAIRKWMLQYQDGKFVKHAWNEIKINGEWLVSDVTFVKPWTPPEVMSTYEALPRLWINKDGQFIPFYKFNEMKKAA